MNKKPLIGIVGKPLLPHQLTQNVWKRIVINSEFQEIVVRLGGVPLGIIPNHFSNHSDIDNELEELTQEDKEDLISVVSMCDGIILQGGLTSDTYEIEIVKYAIENNIPLIGICAGFNNIARAINIPLVHKPYLSQYHDVYNKKYRHDVFINKKHPQSVLFSEITQVNSFHSMFINETDIKNKHDIEVLATSKDNGEKHIEAFTVANTKFVMAIKWHPEIMEFEHQRLIFGLFMNYCENLQLDDKTEKNA